MVFVLRASIKSKLKLEQTLQKSIIRKFSNKPGVISGLFLVIYSIFRFIVEFYRVPDEQLGYIFLNLTMGQVVSLIFIISGVILFYLKYETR